MTSPVSPLYQSQTDSHAETLDGLHRTLCQAQLALFQAIVEADRTQSWRHDGARDLAAWLSMRYGISGWKARRWIATAHALKWLPLIREAFGTGELGVDKVIELTRFAAPETEMKLIRWAKRVSAAAIRHKGDLMARQSIQDVREVDRARFCSWWYLDDGRRFGLEAELPAASGAVVARALERLAESLPVLPGEEDPVHMDARRADALVALCSTKVASDPDPDRATVVVHAQVEALAPDGIGAELEGGPVIHSETTRRLACSARVQWAVQDASGQLLGVGRMRREPPAWMVRQLRYRDRGCVFPGCGSRRWTQAHHIVWWERGGTTDLDNLALVCLFHHRLVHEHGWSIRPGPDGTHRWFRPDGRRHRAGPSPPDVPSAAERVWLVGNA